MKKLLLSILLLTSSLCYSADTFYLTILKQTSNDWFIKLAKDKVKIIKIKNLDLAVDGQLLIIYEFTD